MVNVGTEGLGGGWGIPLVSWHEKRDFYIVK